MLNITIIAMGKLKEQYLRDASAEYQKRLSTLCKLNIVELNPEKLSDNPSAKEIENALNNEAKKIIEKIPKGAKVYSMCIEGKQRTSEELTQKLAKRLKLQHLRHPRSSLAKLIKTLLINNTNRIKTAC